MNLLIVKLSLITIYCSQIGRRLLDSLICGIFREHLVLGWLGVGGVPFDFGKEMLLLEGKKIVSADYPLPTLPTSNSLPHKIHRLN